MRFAALVSAPMLFSIISVSSARAWWDEGHMQIAYLA
jgi:hypothetical protein